MTPICGSGKDKPQIPLPQRFSVQLQLKRRCKMDSISDMQIGQRGLLEHFLLKRYSFVAIALGRNFQMTTKAPNFFQIKGRIIVCDVFGDSPMLALPLSLTHTHYVTRLFHTRTWSIVQHNIKDLIINFSFFSSFFSAKDQSNPMFSH